MYLNPNLGELVRVQVRLNRIKVEICLKFGTLIHTYVICENTTFSTMTLLILLISVFFPKKSAFFLQK